MSKGVPLIFSPFGYFLNFTLGIFHPINWLDSGYQHPFVYWKPLKGTLANSEDPDEMQHNAAFHQDLHCLQIHVVKKTSGTEIHHNLENSTFDPLKYTMGRHILIVSIYMGKSIIIQRVEKQVWIPISWLLRIWNCIFS